MVKRGTSHDELAAATDAKRKPPLVLAVADSTMQSEYASRQAECEQAVSTYAKRVDSYRHKLEATAHLSRVGAYVLTLPDNSFMRPDELHACKRASVSDGKGDFAKALHRRTLKSLKLPSDATELHIQTTGGRKVAVLLLNALAADVAARGHGALNRIHDENSRGWMGGCEADGVSIPQLITHALSTVKGSWAYGIQEGFTVLSLAPRGGNPENGLVLTYRNRLGKVNRVVYQ